MALYYFLEEVSRRKENPRRFVTEYRGQYRWTIKASAKMYPPKEVVVALAELGAHKWVFQPSPVEVVHEPT